MTTTLTVAGLAHDPALGLAVVGGQRALDRPVLAVYSSDISDPTPWMAEGSLLLTVGAFIAHDESAGVSLIRRLDEHAMSALALAITPYLDEVPASMIHEADRLGLPLLAVPPTTPFRAVTAYVNSRLSSDETVELVEGTAVRERLLGAVAAAGGADAVADILSGYLDMDVIVYSASGDVLAHGCPPGPHRNRPPAAVIWNGINSARSVYEHTTRLAGTTLRADVFPAGTSMLTVIRDRDQHLRDATVQVIEFAARLLSIQTHRHSETGLILEASDVLAGLLHGRTSDVGVVRGAIERSGAPRGAAWRILAVRTTGGSSADVRSIARTIASAGYPIITTDMGECTAGVVVASDHDVPGIRTAVRNRWPDAVIGVAAAADPDAGTIPASYVEALYLATVDRAAIDPLEAILLGTDTTKLTALADPVFGPLTTSDARHGTELVTTLAALVRHEFVVQETADALMLHRNALRKRSARIETLTGIDVSRASGVCTVRVATTAARILRARMAALP